MLEVIPEELQLLDRLFPLCKLGTLRANRTLQEAWVVRLLWHPSQGVAI